MVVTRTVSANGRVYLGTVKGSDAGRRRQREPYVGARLHGQQVDVRFGTTELAVIVTDGDGQDTVVPVVNRPGWELTGAEFSRLPGVRNTTAVEAVNPVVAGWSEGHTGVAGDPGQSGAAANVITGPRLTDTNPANTIQ